MNRNRTWIIVLISGFLGLMVDGMDLMFLSYCLPSLSKDLILSPSFSLSPPPRWDLPTLIGNLRRYDSSLFSAWAPSTGPLGSVAQVGRLEKWGWHDFPIPVNYCKYGSSRGRKFVPVPIFPARGVAPRTAKFRGTVLGTLQAGWSVGYVVATLLAGWIIPAFGWRWLFATALAPVVLALLIGKVVPEPDSWKSAPPRRGNEWRLVFASREAVRIFVLWTLTTGFLQFGYYGVNNWLPTYLLNELHFDFTRMTGYLVGTYTAMVAGKVVAGYLADRVGRRWIYVAGGIGTAVLLPLIVRLHTPGNVVLLLTVFGFLYGVPFGVNGAYMTESFETRIRATAMGGAYNIGRLGAAIAPAAIGGIATNYSIGLGFLLMAGAYLLAGIIPALFIPEKIYDPQALPAAALANVTAVT